MKEALDRLTTRVELLFRHEPTLILRARADGDLDSAYLVPPHRWSVADCWHHDANEEDFTEWLQGITLRYGTGRVVPVGPDDG